MCPAETTNAPESPPRKAEPRPRLSRRKRLLFRLVLLVLFLAVTEGLCWAVIGIQAVTGIQRDKDLRRTGQVFAEQSDQVRWLLDPNVTHALELHPVLGWRTTANSRGEHHQHNSKALRSAREYTPAPGPGVLRVAAFGDSCVYGTEVEGPDAWAALVEKNGPDLEVLNYGVPGYGNDQAYLRYCLEGSELKPQVVLMGFTPDDLGRTVNVYRRFLSSRNPPFFKPRYELDAQGKLRLLEVPVRGREDYERILANPREVLRFAEHDHWYRPSVYENPVYDYSAAVRVLSTLAGWAHGRCFDRDRPVRGNVFNEDSTAFKIEVAILERFAASVREAGARPLVLMLPEEQSVRRARRGERTVYDPLLTHLRQRGIPYADAAEAFQAVGEPVDVKGWFAPGGHYSQSGNRVVASWLTGVLRNGADSPHGRP